MGGNTGEIQIGSERLLFLTFSVLIVNPKKLRSTLLHGGQSARGLLNREKRTKENIWQHTPTHTARSEINVEEKPTVILGPLENPFNISTANVPT